MSNSRVLVTKPIHWAAKYIGRPWLPGGRGPEAFDCWGLVRWIRHYDFCNEWLPLYPILPEQRAAVALALQHATSSPDWQHLASPRDGAIVGLSSNQKFHHVGIYAAIDGGLILHADDPKVIAQSISGLQVAGWRRIEFYWHSSWLQNPHT